MTTGLPNGGHYVFASYAHADGTDVYREIEALTASGVEVYFDAGIHPGRAWQNELAGAIEGCSLFLFFLSERSAASANCQRELSFALARDRPVLAVYLEEFAPPAWIELAIGDRQAIHRQRLDDGAFRERLRGAVEGHLDTVPDGSRRSPAPTHAPFARARRARFERIGWLTAVAVLGSLLGWALLRQDEPVETPVARFTITPVEGTAVFAGYDQPLALSPDGRVLVYVAVDTSGIRSLWKRPLDAPEATRLAGTDGANFPFWSPDGHWIAFFSDRTLKKLPAEGGAAQVIARDVMTVAGATWGASGDILFVPTPTSGLSRVAANGGPVSRMPAEGALLWPSFVGDSNRFLFVRADGRRSLETSTLDGAPPVRLMDFPQAFITAVINVPGYVLYASDGALFARSFDVDALALRGAPVRLVDGVPVTGPGRAPFTVSATGVLAFWTYPVGEPATLEWFDRTGRTQGRAAPVQQQFGFAVDSGARRAVVSEVGRDGRARLMVRDLTRAAAWPLSEGTNDFTPVWSPDDRRVAFASARDGAPDVYALEAEAREPPVRLEQSPEPSFPSSWSRDGRSLVIVMLRPDTGADLAVVDLASGVVRDLPINTRFGESVGQLSPDGRWLLYVTDETGRDEVWLADFPAAQARVQVSLQGARWPMWSPDGSEALFVGRDRRFMRASVATADELVVGEPEPLFDASRLVDNGFGALFPTAAVYAVTASERYLFTTRAPDPDVPPLQVVVNWPSLAQ